MAIFQRSLAARFAREPAAFVAAHDLSAARTVMDVGGGHGMLLSAVLAAARAGAGGPLPRTRFVAHDFFRPFPVRADLILLKRVIHDWEDAEAAVILGHARAALDPGGRVVVLDALVEDDDAPDPVKLLDLHILLLPGGRQRTRAEFERVFAAAGLRLRDARRILPDLALIEGEAA